jgi:hypothetical protein
MIIQWNNIFLRACVDDQVLKRKYIFPKIVKYCHIDILIKYNGVKNVKPLVVLLFESEKNNWSKFVKNGFSVNVIESLLSDYFF